MNELSSLGLILLLALLSGHLVQALKIPEVTGYIIAGILWGPPSWAGSAPRTYKPLKSSPKSPSA